MYYNIKTFFDFIAFMFAISFSFIGIIEVIIIAITRDSNNFFMLLFGMLLAFFGIYGIYITFKLINDMSNRIKELEEE